MVNYFDECKSSIVKLNQSKWRFILLLTCGGHICKTSRFIWTRHNPSDPILFLGMYLLHHTCEQDLCSPLRLSYFLRLTFCFLCPPTSKSCAYSKWLPFTKKLILALLLLLLDFSWCENWYWRRIGEKGASSGLNMSFSGVMWLCCTVLSSSVCVWCMTTTNVLHILKKNCYINIYIIHI